MRSSRKAFSSRICRLFRYTEFVLPICLLVSNWGATEAKAATSEIDSYQLAVTSQSKETALAFIEEFGSSHLVGDLIESLQRDVAREVCGGLSSGPSSALAACAKLQPITSIEPSIETPRQSLAPDPAAESGVSDTSISPAAGPELSSYEFADARLHTGASVARHDANAPAVLPNPDDSVDHSESGQSVHTATSPKEPKEAPKPHHDLAPSAPNPGGDPGSDPGSASSPSSHGKDPGSDGGSGSSGGSDHDSHN
jgi:hypothetical protein